MQGAPQDGDSTPVHASNAQLTGTRLVGMAPARLAHLA
jgi:hypothetical protein